MSSAQSAGVQSTTATTRPAGRNHHMKSSPDQLTGTTGSTIPQDTRLNQGAKSYAARGWSVIPVTRHEKIPAIKWEAYQQQAADEGKLDSWFSPRYEGNLGIVTGRVSDLRVLDVDRIEAKWVQLLLDHDLPKTLTVRTGKGTHYYYRYGGNGRSSKGTERTVPGVDIRGDGGYVVAPPSVHENGKEYQFEDASYPLADWPTWLDDVFFPQQLEVRASVVTTSSPDDTNYGRVTLSNVLDEVKHSEPGNRNNTLLTGARRIGQLISSGYLADTRTDELRTKLYELGAELQGTWQGQRTVDSGFEYGLSHPFVKEELEEDDPETEEPYFTSISSWDKGASTQMWVWSDWVPCNELTVLTGQPKVGKGLITSRIIAGVTNGELPGSFSGEPKRVLVSFTEDNYPTMVVPRLKAVGADMSSVFNISPTRRDLSPEGLRKLEETIRSLDAVLVVLDQLSDHFIPGKDGWKNDSGYVRPVMLSLLGIAQRTGCAILGVLHDRKGQQSGVDGIEGSGAWGAVPRHLLRADGRRRSGSLAVVRSNVGGTPAPKEFRYHDNSIEWSGDGQS